MSYLDQLLSNFISLRNCSQKVCISTSFNFKYFLNLFPQVGWQGRLIITRELITEMRSYGTLKERTFLGNLKCTRRDYWLLWDL